LQVVGEGEFGDMEQESKETVEIFVKAACPYSRALKRKLQHDGTPYVEHDVEGDPATLNRMLELNGGRPRVPTIVVSGKVTVGFHGS
jgi:glutaredoxin